MKQLTKESMAYMHTLSFENIYILSIKQNLRKLFFKINKK
jgi:hypothetical protein